MEIGDKLWIVEKNYRGIIQDPKEVTVSKVGRKYFELEGHYREKFDLGTLKEHGDSNYLSQCYYTLQEILDARETTSLVDTIRRYFSGYGKISLSLEQLRKINESITP